MNKELHAYKVNKPLIIIKTLTAVRDDVQAGHYSKNKEIIFLETELVTKQLVVDSLNGIRIGKSQDFPKAVMTEIQPHAYFINDTGIVF